MISPFRYLKTRVFITLGLSVGMLLVLLSVMIYLQYSNDQARAIRTRMASLARTAALMVNAAEHRAILDRATEENPLYRAEVSKLRAFRTANPDIKYIYTMALKDGRIVFVLDPAPHGDGDGDGVDDHSYIGQDYAEGPAADIMKAFGGKESFSSYTDRWGSFLSVFVPIRHGGAVTGVMGLDMTLSDIARLKGMLRVRLALILGTGALVIAVISYFITALFLGPIQRLGETVRALPAAGASPLDTENLHEELLPFVDKINDYLGRVRDELAARRKTEEALAGSERRYRELADLLPQIVFEADTSGTLTFLNAGGYRLLRYTPEDLARGITEPELILPEDRDRAARTISSVLIDGRSEIANEYRVLRKDGSIFPALIYSTPVVSEGRVTGIRGIIVDITERKRAEDDLRQFQKMEVVGTLAGGIAHDFNNLLSGITASLKLLNYILMEEKLSKGGEAARYLETAMDSSFRAAELVKQLLTLSRKREIEMVPVDINRLLGETLSICRSSFPKTVKFDFNPGGDPMIVNADPTQIQQALLNLCVNALHAMTGMRPRGEPQGGRLAVEVKPAAGKDIICAFIPEARKESLYAAIRVSDTGVGMDRETIDRVFEPFFTTKEQGEGTGLGLTMTYSIVTQHGGFIDIQSQPGKGSVVTLYLPLMEGAGPSPGA